MRKAPNAVDKLVGAKIRARRKLKGMSQSALADAIGVTFQQVQKYENGANRIGASRLQQIATALGVSIEHLFEGAAGPAGAEAAQATEVLSAFLALPEGPRLITGFLAIDDPNVRRRVADLIQALAGQGGLALRAAPAAETV
jgi:transcriptional regulator with XRE-family HTH domain